MLKISEFESQTIASYYVDANPGMIVILDMFLIEKYPRTFMDMYLICHGAKLASKAGSEEEKIYTFMRDIAELRL